jgi:hypothetical protein
VDRRLFDADSDPDPAFNIVAYLDPVHMLENQQFVLTFMYSSAILHTR